MSDEERDDDDLDELLEGGDEPQTARERFRRKAQTEGLDIAYRALIEVLSDSKAPAPARATAGGLLLRAAGVFSKKYEEEGASDDNGLARATQAELVALRKHFRAKARKLERRSKKGGDDGDGGDGDEGCSGGGVFG